MFVHPRSIVKLERVSNIVCSHSLENQPILDVNDHTANKCTRGIVNKLNTTTASRKKGKGRNLGVLHLFYKIKLRQIELQKEFSNSKRDGRGFI